jgi:murein DD-endopeptidase MepM/ murein hydrolase activator NlpD
VENRAFSDTEMSAFEPGTPARSKRTVLVVSLIVLAVLFTVLWLLWPRFEREAPQVRLSPDTDVLGVAPLEIVVSDKGAGLKSVTATLSSGGTDHPLAAEQLAQAAAEHKIAVEAARLKGLKEGPAVLKVTARDRSWWKWFGGNETVFQKNLAIDVTPPSLDLVADDRYVSFGGAGVIVYRPSGDTVTSGIKIGKYYFPGYPGQIKGNPDHHLVIFAHPYDTPSDARAVLVATDKAGNTREMRLVYELRGVNYRKSTLKVTDAFIEAKVRPLVTDVSARQASPKDVFIRVNDGLRKENDARIAQITSRGTPRMLWQGAFSQLSNSKVEANFADARSYDYNGEIISNAYHLGFDLSVTRQYPVEAANSGTVAFTGDLGIYGNTVILDHGLGLFTLYSHLSSIGAKEGDSVKARDILGKTGETGLAAGDHLHYGVYLNGVPVLPIEWWDPKWINDNIAPKLEGHSGEEIHKAQAPPRKAARKKRR